jgi:hypothetical protein
MTALRAGIGSDLSAVLCLQIRDWIPLCEESAHLRNEVFGVSVESTVVVARRPAISLLRLTDPCRVARHTVATTPEG